MTYINLGGPSCGDELLDYFEILDKILDSIPHQNYECYYVTNGETPGFVSIKSLYDIKYKQKLVIWVCNDHLRGHHEFMYYNGDTKPHGLVDLEQICRQNPDKKFLLLSPQRNMQSLIEVPNLKISELPPFNWMINTSHNSYHHGYLTKSLMSDRAWVVFSNYPLWHRIGLLAYVSFLNLDQTGFLTLSPSARELVQTYYQMQEFFGFPLSDFELHCFNQGYSRIRNNQVELLKVEPYGSFLSSENVKNYNEILLNVYNRVKVELVPGSIFSEPTPYPTEKELQSIYGSNFMILFGPIGSVKMLRSWGFDMFDDIVNHDYDFESDPKKRIMKAINDNIRLLYGSLPIDQLWQDNINRFKSNCLNADIVLQNLIDQSISDAQHQINQITNEVN